MAKPKSRWVCQECGTHSSRFMGRCTECGAWNSFVEEILTEEPAAGKGKGARSVKPSAGPTPLDSVDSEEIPRILSGIEAVDDVLGGGLVPGSVILLAGDPGIGKSTLLLQISAMIARTAQVLYVSGEESAQQVRLRAARLGISSPRILVDSEQNMTVIEKRLQESEAQVVIIDSIQSVYHPEITSAPGSVSQVRESAGLILSAAKARGMAAILVGHVTKDGSIAGPRVLEHMVDVVLQFEGERTHQLRILRAAKNRFGSTQETGIFTMNEQGLSQVDNPSSLFLGDRLSRGQGSRAPSGTAVIAGGEGTRSLLLEVQALVGSSPYPSPRRVANGWDLNRLLQILAVLEKRVGLSFLRSDVYVNIVGGFEFSDPAGDLGVSIAVATSALDRSIDPKLILIGEVGLTGEVRPIAGLERRLREAARMGFRSAIVPKGNLPLSSLVDNIEIKGVEFLIEALETVMPGQAMGGGRSETGRMPALPGVED
jgi:DNA repair protein RadA/Sms